MKKADVIIVGSGLASLQLARHLSKDLNVIVLTKSFLKHSNSTYAQGGIAAAIGPSDTPYLHYLDTLEAGCHLNHPRAVMRLVQEAPALVEELIKDGCQFDTDDTGALLLGKEGAHNQRRIVHGGGDQTGKRIVEGLIQHLSFNISIYENQFVFELLIDDLGRCYGVKSKDQENCTHTFSAPYVVLSTGGCGQIYSFTSNADTITGDGMSLAYIAGAELADMEFIQFHPTLLYSNGETKGLITEAVRGEGAVLINETGERIMEHVHPLKDLAPRHIVAQNIYDYLRKGQSIYLDITSIKDFQKKFPTVTVLCKEHGIDLSKGLIPVAPGAHFAMGGIQTDSIGRTTVEGLYALGETACTGVHGANRLASNSLLEALIFGKRLAEYINCNSGKHIPIHKNKKNAMLLSPTLPEKELIQHFMMDRVGIVRSAQELTEQMEWLESFQLEKFHESRLDLLTVEQITRFFMMQTAWIVTASALEREESRGGHYRSDFPIERENWQKQQITLQRSLERRAFNEQIKS
ncbi:L-aspartate oxidase [Halobacillus alkaliphilus]|uniref:L-aspartate oxidase n=1 Tax=Halobacillus alkaliphilus TaxID=396056 RepID=A0A1I2PXQ3_9BACI|nr:L-aspartate oxidase [Halobacillus alkaliphilus]SFG18797.1 L-aspartate oxidase [Halobacillus alkaliphilus]